MPITPDAFVAIDAQGIPRLQNYLRALPPAVADAVMDAVAKALIDIMRTSQPPPKYVTRAAAYDGQTFFSEKQRRWFFANLADGGIKVPYHRTQEMSKAWRQIGKGASSILANEAPGAEFVIGDEHQSRHEKLVGWKTTSMTIAQHMPRIEKVAAAAAHQGIKKVPVPQE